MVFSSEALGAFHAFARGPVIAVWVAVALVAVALGARALRRGGLPPALWPRMPRQRLAAVALGCIAFILAACLLTALLSPQSDWDVLAYHMPRVRHWLQNRGFSHYPSHVLRQVSLPPGAGYPVAVLQLLVGGDRLASLPQWGAFAGCIVITARLTRRLVGRAAVIPAALACATVPMAIMEATHAQSDLLAAFWFACFVSLVYERSRYRFSDVLYLAGALGLGLVTKPTVLLFAAPFIVILALRALRRGWTRGLAVPAAVVLLAMLPGLPHAVRNQRLFGRPLGLRLGTDLVRVDARVVASNVLRHAALNAPIAGIWQAIDWTHRRVLHIDASDPGTTFGETRFDPGLIINLLNPDENFVANPLHVALALGATVALCLRRRRGRQALRLQLALALGIAFVCYCAALRWQPWANRLLLPLLLLSSPLLGWALMAMHAALRVTFAAVLTLFGIALSLTNIHHPLLPLPPTWTQENPSPSILTQPREALYFANYDPGLREHYEGVLRQATAAGCARVDLISDEQATEYLLWVTLDRTGTPAQIRHVEVANASRDASTERLTAAPCGQVTMRNLWVRSATFR